MVKSQCIGSKKTTEKEDDDREEGWPFMKLHITMLLIAVLILLVSYAIAQDCTCEGCDECPCTIGQVGCSNCGKAICYDPTYPCKYAPYCGTLTHLTCGYEYVDCHGITCDVRSLETQSVCQGVTWEGTIDTCCTKE